MNDRWLYPIEIKAGSNVLRIIDEADSLTKTVTVPPGVYYQGASLPGGRSSLMIAVRTAMAIPLGRTPGVLPVTHAGQTSSILDISSVQFVDGGAGFRFAFSDPLFTLDPRILGFPAGTIVDTGVAPLPTISMLGSWQSFNIIDGEATDKRRNKKKELYASTSVLYSTTRQNQARKPRRIRTMAYEYVPALHVHESAERAADPSHVELSGLATGDTANAFEHVWESGSSLGEIIIIHGAGNGTWGSVSARQYDIVKFATTEQRENFSNTYEDLRAGGELYRISVDLLILESTYDY